MVLIIYMLANPIVTFLTTDIPQAWVQVNPFFWVTADHQILTPFFHSCLFLVVYSQCFRGCFFTVGRFGSFFHNWYFCLDQNAPCFLHSCENDLKKIPPHRTMHCVPSACGFMENHCQDCCYLGYANIFCVCNLYDICHKIALKCVEATWTQILGNHFCCTKRVTLKLLSQLTRET